MPGIQKLDLKRDYAALYRAPAKEPILLDVPPLRFLAVDGQGDPSAPPEVSPAYQDAVQALYSVAYPLKFAVKKTLGIDYPVMALEGLWWADDMSAFSMQTKQAWKWTVLILQPDCVSEELVRQQQALAFAKKQMAAIQRLRLETFHEGLSAQVMHVGPYAAEPPTIARLHDFIHANGYALRGKHHEIYLSNPRRSAPEKLKTILRQPVAKD